MKKTDFGLIGLGVMGSSLARNIESRGFSVSVYNRSFDKTQKFLKEFSENNFVGQKSLKKFVESIKPPRKIMIMVKAGPAVDAVIKQLMPYLGKGDILIDGGNSYYRDTERRVEELKKKKIGFLGVGVSGGEEGALKGPSIMPGGSKQAWQKSRKIFESISAKDFSGGSCVSYIGDGGAGHYVKMVHNGIEYAIMQLMAEIYSLFRKVYGLEANEISKIFAKYNRGKLSSFLFEIAVPVLAKEDETDKKSCCLIYQILDKAGSKGTGKWTSVDALDRGVAVPSIAEAVFARSISSEKEDRVRLNKLYKHKHPKTKILLPAFTKLAEDALYASIISIFSQGFELVSTASEEQKWQIDLAEVARIWQGGCIIRAKLLGTLTKVYLGINTQSKNLFYSKEIVTLLKKDAPKLRKLVSECVQTGIAIPGFASSLFYFESMIEERLPANFIQGLRDYFGAHTYERVDKKGSFHTEWEI